MDISQYKSGFYVERPGYKSFTPSKINHEWTWNDPRINVLLEEANHSLGELNAYSFSAPDVDVYIRMHVLKEATSSSRIEGTKTVIDEALLKKREIEPERRDDWQEVQNYIAAMNYSVSELRRTPVSTRLIKAAHERLMKGVRGKEKMPGEYRRSQNWIGGATLQDAVFIPPHHTEVGELLGDLENFLHNRNIHVPFIIRNAIAHYQFETIHPFLDGNGRIGRLIITLYLVSTGLLKKPTLYLSDYFERNKGLYYDKLTIVRTSHDITGWIKFFMTAVIETSKKGVATFQKIHNLKEDIEGNKIVTLGKRLPKARKFMNLLYRKPVIGANEVEKHLDIAPATAYRLIDDFITLKILKPLTKEKRNRLFIFDKYIDLFR